MLNRAVWRSLLALPLACAVGVALNCGSCTKRASTAQAQPTDLLTLASAQTTAALWVANLDDGMHDIAQFTAALLSDPSQTASVQRSHAALVKFLGFDPFAAGGFASVGIKAEQGLLVFGEGALRFPLMALGVSNAASLDAYLIGLVSRLDGAQEHTTAQQAGFTVHCLSRPFGKSHVVSMHWAQVRGYVLLAPGGDDAGLQRALTRLQTAAGDAGPVGVGAGAPAPAVPVATDTGSASATASLLSSPSYQETLRHLSAAQNHPPRSGSVHLYARLEGDSTDRQAHSVAATLQIDRRGFAVQSFASAVLPNLSAALKLHSSDANSTLALSEQLSDKPVALLLSRAALPEAVQELLHHPALSPLLLRATTYVTRLTGVDLERDVAPQLTGDLSAAMYLPNPQALLAVRSMQQLHAGGGLQAEAVVGVADPNRLREVLRKAWAPRDTEVKSQAPVDTKHAAQPPMAAKHSAEATLDAKHAAQAPLTSKRAAVGAAANVALGYVSHGQRADAATQSHTASGR